MDVAQRWALCRRARQATSPPVRPSPPYCRGSHWQPWCCLGLGVCPVRMVDSPPLGGAGERRLTRVGEALVSCWRCGLVCGLFTTCWYMTFSGSLVRENATFEYPALVIHRADFAKSGSFSKRDEARGGETGDTGAGSVQDLVKCSRVHTVVPGSRYGSQVDE